MKVVSDASAIIALSAIEQLGILRTLYQTISIPEAVRREILASGPSRPGGDQLSKAPWIVVRPVGDLSLAGALGEELGEGEAESIALAKEIDADILLMDEKRGRRMARRQGVQVVGLLGALVEARRAGHIGEMKPILHSLILNAGFHVGPELRRTVLLAVQEEP